MGQGPSVVRGLEPRAARSLGLAGDAGEPLLLALALLNAAEVSWLLGRQVSVFVPHTEYTKDISLRYRSSFKFGPDIVTK